MAKEMEKKYTLQLTEEEIRVLVGMINNENVELVQRVSDGQARIETINKLITVVGGNNKDDTKDKH